MRRPSWKKTTPKRDDPAGRARDLLERLAISIVTQSDEVLGSGVSMSFAPPARQAAEGLDIDEMTRVWSASVDGLAIWCVVSGVGQRSILECALDGPGSPRQTPVERTIVGECVQRLLNSRFAGWREVASIAIAREELWRCDLTAVHSDHCATYLSLCAEAKQIVARAFPSLVGVPLAFTVHLDPLVTTLGALSQWRPGEHVPLGIKADGLRVALSVPNGPVAYGKLGQIGGARAIRLSGDAARHGRT